MEREEKVGRLKELARERWGERWGVQVLHFADGDYQVFAFQNRGRTDDGYLEVDRLFLSDDGGVYVERAVEERRDFSTEVIDTFHA